jgi:tetratricopeptide (TPR) repeat protein
LKASLTITSSYVIYGLGGVGKSQIAIEYSYRHRDDFDIIHWLRADNYETLLTSYSQLYHHACFRGFTGLDLGDETDLEKIATSVKLWFENCQAVRWLLVIDNADKLERDNRNSSIISQLIPRGRTGHVLVTSRAVSAIGQLAPNGQELLVMGEEDATRFLYECSKAEESEDAAALVGELGRLPLAIEQAGGLIREARVTIAEYRRLYKANISEALREGLSDRHRREYYHETVSTTWNVSVDAIDQKDRLAATIFRIAAFLDGKQIQKDLFYEVELSVDGSREKVSEWQANKAFQTLMSYSLIRPIKDDDALEMHSLVQAVIRDDEKTDRLLCFGKSAELVSRRFPFENLRLCRKYLSQAQNCLSIAKDLQFETPTIQNILGSLGCYWFEVGQFQEALVTFKRLLDVDEGRFGIDHIDSAYLISNIGAMYQSQGKYDEAILWLERALNICEREFGDDLGFAYASNNLGVVYKSQGKYDEAIQAYERARIIYKREFGDDSIDSARLSHNLGVLYESQGKYDEATQAYERACIICKREFGGSIDYARTSNNLGLMYQSQGKHDEAILAFERALKIYEREFGVDHIKIAGVSNNLGLVYRSQGKYNEARLAVERALKICEREFGADHIKIADTSNNLGLVYQSQEKHDEAILVFERALKIYEREFGDDHIEFAGTSNNLGLVYRSQGKHDEAILVFERALKIYEREFGANHIKVAGTSNSLGLVYQSQGKHDEAILAFERALKIYDGKSGSTHQYSANSLHNMGLTYQCLGRWTSAQSYYKRATDLHRQFRGPEHPFTLGSERALADMNNVLDEIGG